jgi:hypothetical protein
MRRRKKGRDVEMIIWLVIAALTIIPVFKLLPHFGINAYWAFVCVIPIGTIALLWFMALKLQELEKR